MKQLTDEAIVKALECCSTHTIECKECPLYFKDDVCSSFKRHRLTLDLINRQKAEIERLKKEIAKEVKHGQWIEDGNGVQVCSECGEEHEWQDFRAPYCDMCGAKMEKNCLE